MKNHRFLCSNCLCNSHSFNRCTLPIVSYGVLAYYVTSDNKPNFVIIQRKNTIGFTDFIRGKYSDEYEKISLIDEMSFNEKKLILTKTFRELWEHLWVNKNSRIYRNEFKYANSKFLKRDAIESVRESIMFTKWSDTEYVIPKGRRTREESCLECAKREFFEETKIKLDNDLSVLIQDTPLEELFIGSNGIYYRHVYYIYKLSSSYIPNVDYTDTLQYGEVKDVRLMSLKDSINSFRDYETSKRNILYRVVDVINKSSIT